MSRRGDGESVIPRTGVMSDASPHRGSMSQLAAEQARSLVMPGSEAESGGSKVHPSDWLYSKVKVSQVEKARIHIGDTISLRVSTGERALQARCTGESRRWPLLHLVMLRYRGSVYSPAIPGGLSPVGPSARRLAFAPASR